MIRGHSQAILNDEPRLPGPPAGTGRLSLPPRARQASTKHVAQCANPDAARSVGFTLIELLVVLVIVGALSAALTLAVGASSERQLDNAAQRFRALIDEACSQAELSGRELGVSVGAGGYSFCRLEGDQWRPFGADAALRARTWPQGLRSHLTRDGRPIAETAEGPQLVCFSSGELTPFELALTLGDAPRYRITGSEAGEVKIDHTEAPL